MLELDRGNGIWATREKTLIITYRYARKIAAPDLPCRNDVDDREPVRELEEKASSLSGTKRSGRNEKGEEKESEKEERKRVKLEGEKEKKGEMESRNEKKGSSTSSDSNSPISH